MADDLGAKTLTSRTDNGAHAAPRAPAQRDAALRRALLFIGLAAASAGLAYALVRATLSRSPADPTADRIQSLIDEANRLLKELDDKKLD